MMNSKAKIQKIHPGLALFVMCFAMSSWIDISGVWVEVPIFVHILPEGWRVPSYLNITIQCSNVFAFAYTIFNKCFSRNQQCCEVIMAYVIMSTGLVALVLLIFQWDQTTWLVGAKRSLALLLLVLFLSVVDTTSSVVYIPYMAQFSEYYMPVYMAGAELGGVITGIAGLIQGVGGEAICYNHTEWKFNYTIEQNYSETSLVVEHKEPRFSVSVFFIFLALLMVTSLISFTFLNFATFSRNKMIRPSAGDIANTVMTESSVHMNAFSNKLLTPNASEEGAPEAEREKMLDFELLLCLFIIGWENFLVYGICSAVHSFSTLPYGSLTYTLAARIATVCGPLGSLSALILSVKSVWMYLVFVLLNTLLTGYHLFLASKSPNPPLRQHTAGAIIAVSIWEFLCLPTGLK